MLIRARSNNDKEARELLYIVKDFKSTFISKDALVELGAISKNFPNPAESLRVDQIVKSGDKYAECGCLRRTATPDPPNLDISPTKENKELLKNLLLEHYSSSTFNTCQHQPLPLMHGPPLEFHVEANARPHAICTPASVPVHWRKQVEEDLRRDVALGVLEEVPENTPVTWCHRMVVCRKHNGDPRRTVDLGKLNNVSIRQCHPTEPALQQAI